MCVCVCGDVNFTFTSIKMYFIVFWIQSKMGFERHLSGLLGKLLEGKEEG